MASATYLLKFKVNPAVDTECVVCRDFESAISEITENVNELEYALEVSGVPGSINSKDVTKNLIAEFNRRELNPDWNEPRPHEWSREKIRRHYEVM
jgi:hypothetical protein